MVLKRQRKYSVLLLTRIISSCSVTSNVLLQPQYLTKSSAQTKMKFFILSVLVVLLVCFSAEGKTRTKRAVQSSKKGCIVQNFYTHGGPSNVILMRYLHLMNIKLNYLLKRVKSCEGNQGGVHCKKSK